MATYCFNTLKRIHYLYNIIKLQFFPVCLIYSVDKLQSEYILQEKLIILNVKAGGTYNYICAIEG
jgi:hypothetical protein